MLGFILVIGVLCVVGYSLIGVKKDSSNSGKILNKVVHGAGNTVKKSITNALDTENPSNRNLRVYNNRIEDMIAKEQVYLQRGITENSCKLKFTVKGRALQAGLMSQSGKSKLQVEKDIFGMMVKKNIQPVSKLNRTVENFLTLGTAIKTVFGLFGNREKSYDDVGSDSIDFNNITPESYKRKKKENLNADMRDDYDTSEWERDLEDLKSRRPSKSKVNNDMINWFDDIVDTSYDIEDEWKDSLSKSLVKRCKTLLSDIDKFYNTYDSSITKDMDDELYYIEDLLKKIISESSRCTSKNVEVGEVFEDIVDTSEDDLSFGNLSYNDLNISDDFGVDYDEISDSKVHKAKSNKSSRPQFESDVMDIFHVDD